MEKGVGHDQGTLLVGSSQGGCTGVGPPRYRPYLSCLRSPQGKPEMFIFT